jgi:rare lipoprotein A (peptidoglycan hydrolase)
MGHRNWHNFSSYKNRVPTVAHKRHELGSFVIFRYNGREVVAMITDRGPYIRGRDWDLNPCLKRKLGFDGVDTVEYNLLKKIG